MNAPKFAGAGLAAALALSGGALAHHSTAEFDYTTILQLKGTVTVRIQHEGKPHDVVLPEGSI